MERYYMRMCMYNVCCSYKESKKYCYTSREYTEIIIDYHVVIHLLVLLSSIFASPNVITEIRTAAMLLVLSYTTVLRSTLKPVWYHYSQILI
jgi:hypothetical protein